MVETIVTTIITVVTGIVAGIGEGIGDLFTSVFMDSAKTAVSPFGVFILAMFGVSVALFIFRWVMGLIRNRG